MSEKRFKLTTEEDICYCEYTYWKGDEPLGMEEVVDVLNEQQATNDYLEEANSRLQIQLGETLRLVDEQQATIKSKDKQLERLYNYFQDYLKDEMSGNAFSEIWDFVKEDEKWEDE